MKKNIILYIIIAILSIYTIGYFIIVNKISYAFTFNETEELYNSETTLILNSAKLYGSNNLDLFKKQNTIYITVNDLVKSGFLYASDDGKFHDYVNEEKTLNDLKIKITYQDDKIDAKILK